MYPAGEGRQLAALGLDVPGCGVFRSLDLTGCVHVGLLAPAEWLLL
jgi:hypothetical protein